MTQSDSLAGEKPSENQKPPSNKRVKKLTWKDWLINGGILVGLLVAISALIFLRSKIPNGTVTLRTKVVMKDIQTAITSYRTEYNQFPVLSGKEDVSVLSEGAWLAALLGEDEKLNPRKIDFFDPRLAKNKKFGLYHENGQPFLVDYWGNKYHVLMDLDDDNRIANPEFNSAKPNKRVEKELAARSLIYSAGPDGDPNTWEDNVCSWREGHRPLLFLQRVPWFFLGGAGLLGSLFFILHAYRPDRD